MAMTQAAKEAVWLQRLLGELGTQINTVALHTDNQGAIALTRHTAFHPRSKHIDIQHHFIREQVTLSTIDISYIPTAKMIADILTKPTSPSVHASHSRSMGLIQGTRE